MNVQCISEKRALLGESPVWFHEENSVYWIDIIEKKLYRTEIKYQNTTTWELPSCPGMIALRARGGLIVALEDGIYAFQPGSGELELLVHLEADIKENRPNDGKCDLTGRLWLGTMNKLDANRQTGSLYRIDPDLTVTKIASQYHIPNGLAWSPDNKLMYHTDTRKNIVWAHKFDAMMGQRTVKREFFHFNRDETGAVDGAAVDMEGGYWSAMYGGKRITRRFPNGKTDFDINLPVTQPTMPTFGGENLSTLFITTARQKIETQDLKDQPMAGALLAVPVTFQGTPVGSFGG